MSRKKPKVKSELRKRREAKGLTLEALGELSGVPGTTIRQLEAGLGRNFRIEIKKAVALGLGLSGNEFFDVFKEELGRLQQVQEFARKED